MNECGSYGKHQDGSRARTKTSEKMDLRADAQPALHKQSQT